MLEGEGRKVFDLTGAGWVGWLVLVFCWGFFNDSLKLLAILELSSLKTSL